MPHERLRKNVDSHSEEHSYDYFTFGPKSFATSKNVFSGYASHTKPTPHTDGPSTITSSKNSTFDDLMDAIGSNINSLGKKPDSVFGPTADQFEIPTKIARIVMDKF